MRSDKLTEATILALQGKLKSKKVENFDGIDMHVASGNYGYKIPFLVDLDKCNFVKVVSADYGARSILLYFDNPNEVIKLENEEDLNTINEETREFITSGFSDLNRFSLAFQREYDDTVYIHLSGNSLSSRDKFIECEDTYFNYDMFIKESFIKVIDDYLVKNNYEKVNYYLGHSNM